MPESSLKFSDLIVEWFRKEARDLPWRKTSDPYRIWISEIMLQQTGVSTVISYFEKFIKRFPTIKDLAAADEHEVLRYWEGLGYYRRAKNLRAGAQMICKEFAGTFPNTRDELLKVPGIGIYSAGAILSIAFRKPQPALDGNLIRVYSRYFGIQDFVDEGSTLKKLWKIAEDQMPRSSEEIRAFTEGMMELGATVCSPKNPRCLFCPVRKNCKSFKEGWQFDLPRKRLSKKREKHEEVVYIFNKKNKLAFLPKGSDPKFPDFLRLPYQKISSRDEIPKAFIHKLKYSVTHRDFVVYLTSGSVRSEVDVPKKNWIWLEEKELSNILLPAIDRKALRYLQESV